MTNFFDELEAQLHEAARAQISVNQLARPPRSAWARSAVRGLPIVLAVVSTLAVATVALVLLGHKSSSPPHQPSGGPPPSSGPPPFPHLSAHQRKQINYVMRAHGTTLSRDRACAPNPRGLGDPSRTPSLSPGSPTAAMLAIIGTLRRPQTPADRLPPRKIWNGPRSKPHTYPYGTYPPVTGIYARYIRYARHRDGANYYLVPAQNVNWQVPVPARCYREQVTALHQEFSRIPPHLRPGIFALQATYLAYERRSTAPYPGICLLALNATGNGDGGCGTGASVSQIEGGHTLSSGAPGGVPVVYGLAPDG
jgi:hypothetical protein